MSSTQGSPQQTHKKPVMHYSLPAVTTRLDLRPRSKLFVRVNRVKKFFEKQVVVFNGPKSHQKKLQPNEGNSSVSVLLLTFSLDQLLREKK